MANLEYLPGAEKEFLDNSTDSTVQFAYALHKYYGFSWIQAAYYAIHFYQPQDALDVLLYG